MTNEEIFIKVIEKAINNGFNFRGECEIGHFILSYTNGFGDEDKVYGGLCGTKYYEIIFNHDFAKAFWKNKEVINYRLKCNKCNNDYNFFDEDDEYFNSKLNAKYCSECGNKLEKYIIGKTLQYKQFLSQMVLEEEPLKYLEKFL